MVSTITPTESRHLMISSDLSPFCVVVAAGGKGRRFGGDVPKQFRSISGAPVLIHTLRRFESSPLTERIILILPEERISWFNTLVHSNYPLSKPLEIVAGGETRQESVYKGLQVIEAEHNPFVAIHDGVRPFFNPQWLEEGSKFLETAPAVAVGIPPVDSVKRVSSRSFITRTQKRESLIMIQTPQMFQTRLIQAVHEDAVKKGWFASDDSTLMEVAGYPVRIMPGSRWNIKITEPEDLEIGEVLLKLQDGLYGKSGGVST